MQLNEAFRFPKPNEFIATNFDIKPRSSEVQEQQYSYCVRMSFFEILSAFT